MNYSDFFFKALEIPMHRAVTHLNYVEAYEGFRAEDSESPNTSVCIMDGSAMGPHFRVLFSEEQDKEFMNADAADMYNVGGTFYENVVCAWDEALAKLSGDLSKQGQPEGYTYFIDEQDGCVFVSVLCDDES
jgi:hypothetical protein